MEEDAGGGVEEEWRRSGGGVEEGGGVEPMDHHTTQHSFLTCETPLAKTMIPKVLT